MAEDRVSFLWSLQYNRNRNAGSTRRRGVSARKAVVLVPVIRREIVHCRLRRKRIRVRQIASGFAEWRQMSLWPSVCFCCAALFTGTLTRRCRWSRIWFTRLLRRLRQTALTGGRRMMIPRQGRDERRNFRAGAPAAAAGRPTLPVVRRFPGTPAARAFPGRRRRRTGRCGAARRGILRRIRRAGRYAGSRRRSPVRRSWRKVHRGSGDGCGVHRRPARGRRCC